MTEENKDEEIKLTPAEESPWHQFLKDIISYDTDDKSLAAFNWFWGIYYAKDRFKNFDLKKIQNMLPDEHPIKKINDDIIAKIETDIVYKNGIYSIVETLFEKLGNPKIIDEMDFSGVVFDNSINFSSFIFPLQVSFKNTTFSNDAFFDGAVFCNNSDFTNTSFLGDTSFNSVKFIQVVNFEGANFLKNASFSNVLFPNIANFQNVNFFKTSNFIGANFPVAAAFRDAKFHDLPLFRNTIFNGNTNFTGVWFETHAPHLHDAKIGADITWDKNIKLWPQTKKHKIDITARKYKTRIENNQSSYENLVHHMKIVEKYHDQHFFFRQEMRCRRKLGSIFNSLIYGFYEYLADYGYGVGRAFSWWLVHIIIGSLALFGFRFFYGINDFINDAGCALGVSLANSHGFFFMGDRLDNCYGVFKDLPFFTAIWATQTVFGIALLFLLLLTLRVRFRLK